MLKFEVLLTESVQFFSSLSRSGYKIIVLHHRRHALSDLVMSITNLVRQVLGNFCHIWDSKLR